MPLTILTGASSGIGRQIAKSLAQAGHELILVGRSQSARTRLLADIPTAQVRTEIADLSLLAQAQAAAARIAGQGRPIHLLINNAGIFTPRREVTAEGHERVLAVNLLAPAVLTRALLPTMQAGARIVNIGSNTSDRARINPDDLEGSRKWGLMHSYAQSKLALLMLTNEWARRLQGTAITANTVHPGAVATRLVRAGGPIGLAWRLMAPFLLTAEQGADTPLHAALSPEFATITGAYVKKRRIVPPNPLALDLALTNRVWNAVWALTGP